MVKVFPITQTIVNWREYLSLAQSVLGHSVSDSLDARRMPADNAAAFIVTLDELCHDKICNPTMVLREAGALLRHVAFGFLIVGPSQVFYDLRENSTLSVTSALTPKDGFKIGVVTGNMEEWRNAIINCANDRTSFELRTLVNQCMLCLEQAGLGEVWANFQKTSMRDKTFRLLPK